MTLPRGRLVALRILTTIAALLVALPAAEALLRGVHRARGRPYSADEAARTFRQFAAPGLRLDLAEDPGAERGPEDEARERILHPYLGWSDARTLRAIAEGAAADVPDAPAAIDVLVLGGSVAAGFGDHGAEALRASLAASPELAGRSVRIANFGSAAYKAPQPLFLLELLTLAGRRFDAVVLVDGFNEVAIPAGNWRGRTDPLYPHALYWTAVTSGVEVDPEAAALLDAMRSARESERGLAGAALALRLERSALLARAVILRLNAVHRDYDGARLRLEDREAAGAGRPGLRGATRAESVEEAVEIGVAAWSESSRAIAALCAGRGAAFVHVLQATLHDAGSKPLTEEERARGRLDPDWREGVLLGYPRLREEGARLRASGVRFVDASGLFRGSTETLYVDACHFAPRGHAMLGEVVGRELAEAFSSLPPSGGGR